jgi:glutamate formiminotransferase/formiminotetrahydrofolate cyclodeaminase
MGAFLNVKINAGGLDDKAYVQQILAQGAEIEKQTLALEAEVLGIVNAKIK